MQTLLNYTSPLEAFEIFEQTFNEKNIGQKLDDATIHFFNTTNLLKTTDPKKIADYINESPNEYFLDILVICHLIRNPFVLVVLKQKAILFRNGIKNDLKRAQLQIEESAKYCDENLLEASKHTFSIMNKELKKAELQVTCINSIISNIKFL